MKVNRVVPGSEPFFTKRRLGWAGIAAVIGCGACCALPLLAVIGAGSGATAAVATFVRPGMELVMGLAFFAVALGIMAVRRRSRNRSGCDTSCSVGAACCDAGEARTKEG